ncbi:uncharacterized protein LOC120255849 [Dioscorea cayenensis subsp. rotundata]|uniref:Uncharacterized protein LOC120255849 n=1 Tax=Dioscorea cayennensis subsp. rotundata TaxID=55577 RepID=A0AB40AWY5_DIOCR|nr:uncharacterized protein LOC120255849 [Dioscorea cayenensis subsp. rotundata]
MKTVFRFQVLWDLVEKGMMESKDEAVERENRKRDAKALCLIQQVVDGSNLDYIAEAKSAYEAWEILRKHCQGMSKVLFMRIQALRQSFETLQMGDDEGVQEYISLGLLQLPTKLRLLDSKKISKLTLDDLCGTLQAHEVKVNRAAGKIVKKALHVKCEHPILNYNKGRGAGSSWGDGRGHVRSFVHWRGRAGVGRGRGFDNRSHIQCFQCKRFGRIKAKCKAKEKQSKKGLTLQQKRTTLRVSSWRAVLLVIYPAQYGGMTPVVLMT